LHALGEEILDTFDFHNFRHFFNPQTTTRGGM
jgi:hypothetical protein